MIGWLLWLGCTGGHGVAVPLLSPDTGTGLPMVSEAWPLDGAVFEVGEELRTSARVSHSELPVEALSLEATLDGEAISDWSLSADGGWTWTTPVETGLHELVLEATDDLGASATATMSWRGNAGPSAEILAPGDDQVYGTAEPIIAEVLFEDPDGDALEWTWLQATQVLAEGSIEAQAGPTTVETTLPELGEGIHELGLEVSDGEVVLRQGVRIRVSTD